MTLLDWKTYVGTYSHWLDSAEQQTPEHETALSRGQNYATYILHYIYTIQSFILIEKITIGQEWPRMESIFVHGWMSKAIYTSIGI